ncbi:MAG: MFS transporter [Alphaproteobacteria bacterium]
MRELLHRDIFHPLLAMLSLQVVGAIATQAAPVLAPEAAHSYGMPVAYIGIYTSIGYAMSMLGGLIGGPLVLRLGSIGTALVGCGLFFGGLAAFTAGIAAVGILSAVMVGLGYGLVNPTSSHILARQSPPRRRAFVFSLKQTGVPIGGTATGILLPLIALNFGWKVAALAAGTLAVVLAVAMLPMRARFDDDRNPQQRIAIKGFVGPLLSILRDRGLRAISVAGFAYASAQVCIISYLVAYLTHVIGLSLVDAGLAFAAFQAGGFAGRVGWGAMADWLIPTARLYALLGILMCIGLSTAAAVTADWPLIAICAVTFLIGTGVLGWNGIYLSEVARMAPGGRISETTGGAQFFMFFGPVVVPPIFGLLAETTGYATAYMVIAIATVASSIYLLTLKGGYTDSTPSNDA